MTIGPTPGFRWKVFASLYIAISMLVIGGSGLVLFLAPPGRVAHWSHWKLAGLTKAQWQAVHTAFAFVFLAVVALHVYYNWKPLVGYLRQLLSNAELAVSVGASLLIAVASIAGWPPFGALMDLGESLKQSWANERTEPPIPHAESMTLTRLCALTGLDVGTVVADLRAQGLPAGPEATIGDLAASAGLTPQQLFERLGGTTPPAGRGSGSSGHGRGLGRKTVGQVCSELGVDTQAALDQLRRRGIDASATDNLRALALEHGRSPSDLVELIAGP
jgi:hypothetical protein